MPKVSVIVPIYNVEKFIERCAVSLFEQTLDDLEYVFVNDCTPDRSMEILHKVLDRYPHRKSQVKIINHEVNKGVAAARNSGLDNVTGEYVIHCDPDDWVEFNMYETLYNKATETKADIVVCDFVHEFGDCQEIEHFDPITNPLDCFSYNTTHLWWGTVNRLISIDLILKHNITFFSEINFCEDLCFLVQSYYYAQDIKYVTKALYHYDRTNESSILHSLNKMAQQEKKLMYHKMDNWFNQIGYQNPTIFTKNKINARDRKLSGIKPNFKLWNKTWPEVVPTILADKSLNWTYRKCYAMATKGFYFPLKLYIKLSNLKNSK